MSIYLHVLLTRTVFVVTHFFLSPPPPHHPTPYPIEDEKSLWAPGAAAELPPLEKGEHYCSLSRRFKDTFSPARRMDPFSLWASRWAHEKTLSPPFFRILLWEHTNGNVDWLGWTYGISVWTENHTFSVCCHRISCQCSYNCCYCLKWAVFGKCAGCESIRDLQ